MPLTLYTVGQIKHTVLNSEDTDGDGGDDDYYGGDVTNHDYENFVTPAPNTKTTAQNGFSDGHFLPTAAIKNINKKPRGDTFIDEYGTNLGDILTDDYVIYDTSTYFDSSSSDKSIHDGLSLIHI